MARDRLIRRDRFLLLSEPPMDVADLDAARDLRRVLLDDRSVRFERILPLAVAEGLRCFVLQLAQLFTHRVRSALCCAGTVPAIVRPSWCPRSPINPEASVRASSARARTLRR